MADVTFGQYYPGNSIIHRIDPRMKTVLIIAMMIAIFVCKSYLSLAITLLAVVIIVAISKVNIKTILKGIKPIVIVVLITTLLNLFYGSGEPIVSFWIFKITENGINNAVFMAFRVIMLIVMGLMLTYTTTPTALTDAVEALLKPLTIFKIDVHTIAMTITIALRFIPTLLEEVEKIMAAQKSRGADMESGGLISRAKAIVPVIIPLFISSFRRANELADAMECRCYRGGKGRSKMNVMHLKTLDYAALALVIAYIAAIILIRIFMADVI